MYVKGTIIRKMSCYCGYILCVTTILKMTNYCCNSPLPCNYLILGFHVTTEKTKTKILCFQVKVIFKHTSTGLSSTVLKIKHGFFTMRDIGIVSG